MEITWKKHFNPQFKKKKDGERQNAVTLPTKTRVKKMFNKHNWYISVI